MTRLLERCTAIYKKNKEIVLYLIFGTCTTFVNWIIYVLALFILPLTVSNAIAWFLSVLFAFVVNKKFVFESKYVSVKQSIKEVVLFYAARVFTGAIDILGLPFLIFIGLDQQIFGIEGAVAKAILTIIGIVLNYIFSKFIIFKKSSVKEGEEENHRTGEN